MDLRCLFTYIFFFFNDTATTEIYTLSLHDALPISSRPVQGNLMKHLLLSVGLAVCPTLSVTQQPAPANLSLADALALARAHNPLYRQALHDRAPAGWAARNAWSSTFLPTLDRKSVV